MQNREKIISFSAAVFIFTLIFTALRVVLMAFSFDFDTYLYSNKTIVSVLFLVFSLFLFSLTFFKKAINSKTEIQENLFSEFLIVIFALLFALLGVSTVMDWSSRQAMFYQPMNGVETVTYILAVPCAFISFIYYLTRLFSKNKSSKTLAILALFPVVALASLLTQNFAKISATASSLAHFPNILSLILLAFFILGEGREYLLNSESDGKYITSLFIAFSSLTFSAIPDLVFTLGDKLPLTFTNFVYLALKLAFIVYTVYRIILLIVNTERGNK